MKKVVRMLGLCALVALAFTACKKDDTQKVSFTASITQPTSTSRTHAVGLGHHLVWDAGDQILVFNNAGEDETFGLPGTGTFEQTATFTAEGEKVDFIANINDEDYYAFYPNAIIEGGRVKMTIPDNQEYKPQRSFTANLYPMVGFNVDENGAYCNNFNFISNAGFLNVSFTCPEILSGEIGITQVVLRSNDPVEDKLNGDVYYDMDGSNYEFVGNTNEITIVPSTAGTLYYDQNRDFTFVLPQGALFSGFEIEVTLTNGEVKLYEAPGPANIIEPMTYTVMIPVTVGTENQLGIVIP